MVTAAQLNALIISQLELYLNQTIPVFPKAFLRVLARVLSSVFIILYKRISFVSLQMFVKTASWEEVTVNGFTARPLLLWGDIIGIGVPKLAVQAEYTLRLEITSLAGGTLPAGSQFLHGESQILFKSLEALDLTTTSVPYIRSVTVRAYADTNGTGGGGVQGNIPLGSTMSLVDAPANIEPDTIVIGQLVDGVDAETEAEYRGRVSDRFKQIPQGGAYADYKWWVLDVPGIVRVYPYTGDTAGEVDVYVDSDDGVPSADQLTAVAAAMDNGYRKQLTVDALNVYPVTYLDFVATVFNLVAPSGTESEVEDRIEAAIEGYGQTREPFIHGLSIPTRRDRMSTGELTGEAASMASALGATIDVVSMELNGSGIQAYSLGKGELADFSVVFE